MATGEGTFSESWYRVSGLRPRLRATVQVRRQRFRGRVWHVVQDPANNEFFRLHEAGYRFVGLLDGRRTVSEAWRASLWAIGDEAVTQTEAIGLLGQLFAANLLQADLPPDAEILFRRHRKRKRRRLAAAASGFLAARIALLDPDAMLGALAGVFGWLFSPVGLVLWLVLLAAGGYCAAAGWRELAAETRSLLGAGRLASSVGWAYAAFVGAKIVHELAHGIACKRFGRLSGGGEVHAMGVMLLVLVPMPYVDASSAWALRSKLHRAIVGAAGMLAELGLAAGAAIVWLATSGSADPWAVGAHAAALRLMLIASVATVVFNGNPLLRFDGYYILSDVLEIPNLAARSRGYLAWLVKRFAWGLRTTADPAGSRSEAAWLAGYGIAAGLFRVAICVKIVLVLIDRFFLAGVALAVAAMVVWLLMPLGRLVHYLLAGAELQRARGRALATTAVLLIAAFVALGAIDAPDRRIVSGTVAAARLAHVHAGADGFIRTVSPSGRRVAGGETGAEATILLEAVNRDLAAEARGLLCDREALAVRLRTARLAAASDGRYLSLVQILAADEADLARQQALLRQELDALSVRAPLAGTWVCDDADRLIGTYVRRGQRIGTVLSLDELVIRAETPQQLVGELIAEAAPAAQLRPAGRPDAVGEGTWRLLPATGDEADTDARRSFTVEVTPTRLPTGPLLPGQRVLIRFALPPKPLAAQWWRSIRQLAQRTVGL